MNTEVSYTTDHVQMLMKERDELAAQVEVMRDALEALARPPRLAD